MKAVIALGSNLGDKESNLTGAINKLSKILTVEKISKFTETDPVGGPEQPNFLNAVIICECNLEPIDLLDKCLEIENEFGRMREIKWGPRTLDIDLISYGDLEIASERLTLPHPLAHKREFVLAPWLSIDSNASLVGHGFISDLLAALK